jgi:hypothetical protein
MEISSRWRMARRRLFFERHARPATAAAGRPRRILGHACARSLALRRRVMRDAPRARTRDGEKKNGVSSWRTVPPRRTSSGVAQPCESSKRRASRFMVTHSIFQAACAFSVSPHARRKARRRLCLQHAPIGLSRQADERPAAIVAKFGAPLRAAIYEIVFRAMSPQMPPRNSRCENLLRRVRIPARGRGTIDRLFDRAANTGQQPHRDTSRPYLGTLALAAPVVFFRTRVASAYSRSITLHRTCSDRPRRVWHATRAECLFPDQWRVP